MTCRLCIFLENGKVYGHHTTRKMVGFYEFNYGTHHKIELIGNYTRKEIKIIYPHARFVNFKDLGLNRIEREKIIELELLSN